VETPDSTHMDRREYLAKLSSDIGKIILIALVVGQIIEMEGKGINLWMLTIGIIVSLSFFATGYFLLKNKI